MTMTNVNCYCRGTGCIYCTEPDDLTKSLNAEWQRQCSTPQRDSAEADAAQALFVEHGFSSQWVITESSPKGWGRVNYANFEAYRQKQAAERLQFPIKPRSIQPSKMPMWGSCIGEVRSMVKELQERGFLVRANVGGQPRIADITGFAAGRRYEYDVEQPHSGGGKTAVMLGTMVHQAMDASQRNEKLKRELIRQYTNAAAFKLGRISKRFVARNQATANILKKDIKDQLAQNLVLIGCSYTEAGEIISELVEGLKNV